MQSPGVGESASFDGVVEAVRQTVMSAQVSGAVVAIDVKVGDVVKTGQVLARIHARAAEHNVAASDALVLSARATLDVATKEFDRQKLLFEKKYTSQAALERAEAQFKATQAQVSAQLAQAGAARTQSVFFVLRAPYGGVIADVPAVLGDMAMPGRPLLTLYDPASLRVTASFRKRKLRALPRASRRRSGSRFRQIANGPLRLGRRYCPRRIRARTPPRSGSTCPQRLAICRREPLPGSGYRCKAPPPLVSMYLPRRSSAAPR